jgi:SAM-dependent methyltransferase
MQELAILHCSEAVGAVCTFEPLGIHGGCGSSVVRCKRCGLGITLPHVPDVASLYADRQSQDFQPKTAGLAAAIKGIAFRSRARSFLRMVAARPHEIIDYGCGSGLFTKCLQAVSGASVHALDFHDTPPVDIGGADYRPFLREAELRGCADILIASHVLEHEDDPVRLINRMANLVKRGGYLIIEVPNIECWGARTFGSNWDGWYLPYHRLHFSPESLRVAVEQAGLEVVKECGATVPTMGRTLANLFRRRYSLFYLLIGAILHPVQWGLEFASGRPSALRIVVRKL